LPNVVVGSHYGSREIKRRVEDIGNVVQVGVGVYWVGRGLALLVVELYWNLEYAIVSLIAGRYWIKTCLGGVWGIACPVIIHAE
jgi:hypothetical protein